MKSFVEGECGRRRVTRRQKRVHARAHSSGEERARRARCSLEKLILEGLDFGPRSEEITPDCWQRSPRRQPFRRAHVEEGVGATFRQVIRPRARARHRERFRVLLSGGGYRGCASFRRWRRRIARVDCHKSVHGITARLDQSKARGPSLFVPGRPRPSHHELRQDRERDPPAESRTKREAAGPAERTPPRSQE